VRISAVRQHSTRLHNEGMTGIAWPSGPVSVSASCRKDARPSIPTAVWFWA